MAFTLEEHAMFRTLRVTHIAKQVEAIIANDANDDLTPAQVFLTACEDAMDLRKANRINGAVKAAGFPFPMAAIAEIDYQEGRNISKTRMNLYANVDWKTDSRNLVVLSPTGGGKTYLVCAIGIAACHNGHSVRYTRADDLARNLTVSRNDAIRHQQMLNELSGVDLLILDDFLTLGIDAESANDLFAILVDRDNKRPTIVASQSGPDFWIKTLPDRVAADSIVNRITSRTRKIELGNFDMRGTLARTDRASKQFWE
jgi:DNA replication protein DnaC